MPLQKTILENIVGPGLSLRSEYVGLAENAGAVYWLEILADNYRDEGSPLHGQLHALARKFPLVFHSVGFNLGGREPIDPAYLASMKRLVDYYKPAWHSDHLCWTAIGEHHHHDLLPLPYTQAYVDCVADRIKQIEDRLGIPFLVENVSSYITFKGSQMPEWEFLMSVAEKADCGLLVDVNNIYVSAHNHGFEGEEYLHGIDQARVHQIHLAGYESSGNALIDTHGAAVSEEVWKLYEKAIDTWGTIPTCIERDNNIPDLSEIGRELSRVAAILEQHSE